MKPGKKKEIACILGIFLCALLLRLYAVTYLPLRGITDDAYEYNYIAQNILQALQGEPLQDRDRFLNLGASRGWLYPLFIAGVYKVFGADALHVRLLQVIIDSLTCILIYCIGRNIFNRRAGIIAGFFSSLYPGFIYYSTMLYQETTTIFLLTLLVFFLGHALSQKRWFLYFASGMLLTIVTFYRSGFLFFSVFFIPTLLLVLWLLYQGNFLRYSFFFLSGWISMLILYGAFSYAVSGAFNFNKPYVSWSVYETIHRDGWLLDTFSPTPTEELNEVAREFAYSVLGEQQTDALPSRVYIMAGIRHIQKNPLAFFSQVIKRIKRMWMYIETYPGRWHSQTVGLQLLFHRCLFVLALLGIPLSLTLLNQSWVFYLIFFYVMTAYITTIGLPRYAIPAMPFVILLASHALVFIMTTLWHERKRFLSSSYAFSWGLTILILASVSYLNLPTLLALFPSATPPFCYTLTIALTNLLFITAAFWVYRVFNLQWKSKKKSMWATVFPVFVIALLYNNDALSSKTWHEWEASLYTDHQKIKQTIVLPHDLNPDNYTKANLVIDMFGGGGKGYNFQVKVNDQMVKVYRSGLKAQEGKFDYKFYGLYKSFFFDTYKLSPEDLRQWYEIALPLHLLKNNSELVVECSLSKITNHGNDYVTIFGDHTTTDEHLFEGPCFPRSDLDTSLIKIMPYSGDHRFEKVTTLESRKTMSEYYDGLKWQHKDLSGARGIQSGSYRIRVELIGNDGSQVIL
jgi:4-amino-4-deoxy-L-arabinose transferase-like glycosyltransferase